MATMPQAGHSVGSGSTYTGFRIPNDDLAWLDEQAAVLRTNRSHLFRLLVANARRQGMSFSVSAPSSRRRRVAAA